MAYALKHLNEQVIVLTGASSGIGLVTAREAAREGASLVLASRNEEDLRQLCNEIRKTGGEAVYAVADVSVPEDVQRIADTAVQAFGGFDTWINNAATAIYGKLTEIPIEEMRRLVDVNFWGTVYGSRVAVRHLKEKGGTIINVGSVVSQRALPLQGIYVSAKHAIKGFTDTLRMELEAEGAPISVTLIMPGSIDTPLAEHARNHLDAEPTYPPPVYAPEVVARAILFCASHARRDVLVGGGAKMMSAMEKYAPRLADFYMERSYFRKQKLDEPRRDEEQEDLFHPARSEGRARGNYPKRVKGSSLYTYLALRPVLRGSLVFGALGLGLLALLRRPEAEPGQVRRVA